MLPKTSIEETLGVRLKRMRVAKRWTQHEVAEKLGVSITSVCNWEKGYTRPRTSAQRQLSSLYNTSLEELFASVRSAELATPSSTLQDNSKERQQLYSLSDVITRSRQAIADSAGLSAASVKITLHY
ncbi:hypothetical protein GCM10023115_00190 [Pontixanthobacter gangjinensis]|uniref:Helix-turn-helix domain-containing protein n=1 Tax=Pontixanthobacter gangjinensis TaxID=1028742 RepID=A0A6I4SI20_9SPHN|nr:helix-turn-helix transcriptional regulator [Pontixanthobacter gangjinensis]MXO55269.1 helix-turn-helix domain-containing protein [Pontixanthobacter gangjinensis]